jgi:DNA polymerase-3 subunit beta
MSTITLTKNVDFTVDTKTLITALKRIKPAVSARCALPILAGVRIDATDGSIRLTATDLELTLSHDVTAAVTTSGSMVVRFADLLRFAEAQKIGPLRLTDDKFQTMLEHGTTTFEPSRLPVEEFPKPVESKGRPVPLSVEALREVIAAVSTDFTRPILCTVWVAAGEYAGTDSYRLYVVSTDEPTGDGFMLAREFVDQLVKVKGLNEVTALVDEKNVTVVLDDGFRLTGRIVGGEFPNYRSLIPSNQPVSVQFDETKAMIDAITKVNKVVNCTSSPTRIEPSEAPGFFTVSKTVQDVGSIKVQVPGDAPLTVSFNGKFLIDLLSTTEVGVMGGVDHLKPWMLTEAAPNVSTTAVRKRLIMPVRVS